MTGVKAIEPALDALLDRDFMAARLGAALGEEETTVLSIRPIVSKPGSRALVAYTVERSSGRTRLLAKHFAKPVRGRRLHETWAALERTDFGPSAGVPRLVAWCPDLNAVVYERAPGRLLDAAIREHGAEVPMRAVGRWLACLHASPVAPDRRFDLQKEVSNLCAWAERVAAAAPAHAADAERLLQGVTRLADDVGLTVEVPIHKDFHYRHVVTGPRLVVLDFDEVRMGDPNFDLAHFCVYLDLLAARSSTVRAMLPGLEADFLTGYEEALGWAPDERFGFFSAYTCLKIAKQLVNGSGVKPCPAGADRDRQLRLILERGCSVCRRDA